MGNQKPGASQCARCGRSQPVPCHAACMPLKLRGSLRCRLSAGLTGQTSMVDECAEGRQAPTGFGNICKASHRVSGGHLRNGHTAISCTENTCAWMPAAMPSRRMHAAIQVVMQAVHKATVLVSLPSSPAPKLLLPCPAAPCCMGWSAGLAPPATHSSCTWPCGFNLER